MTTQLLILAPSKLHQAAWRALIDSQPGLSVVGATSDVTDVSRFRPAPPAVVLVDIPTVHDETASELRTLLPECGLLFLVKSYVLEEIVGLLRAGATGFVAHDASLADLSRGIIAAGRGEIVLPQELATRALVSLARGEVVKEEPSVALTEREQEVLSYLAQGYTNKDIAQTLFLSVRTVEAHLRNIFGKLGVASRTEAALWAVNHDVALGDIT